MAEFKVGDIVQIGGAIHWVVAEVGPCAEDPACVGDVKVRNVEWPQDMEPICFVSSGMRLVERTEAVANDDR